MLFKCQICGGELDLQEKTHIGTCQYCGSKQTLPRLASERQALLYERATKARLANEYDQAAGLYEILLSEDSTDPETYWSLVLCKYGVAYVDDPATNKRILTCNRTQFTSVFEDENYKKAMVYANSEAQALYTAGAKIIDAIQRAALELSAKESPYDIFLCHKATDDSDNSRTIDSILAQDMYSRLTSAGYKVFFSRISLANISGNYEPYIFSALHSAPIMIVLGTKTEYFNAVWVKNEWSRFLGLIKGGAKKTIIPVYRDIDPKDLPVELRNLQAQNRDTIEFYENLLTIIKNQLGAEKKPTTVVSANGAESIYRRGTMALEDGNFSEARKFFDRALNVDPEYAPAYIGMLCTQRKHKHEHELTNSEEPLTKLDEYRKAIRFADADYRKTLESYNQVILNRLDELRREKERAEAEAKAEAERTAEETRQREKRKRQTEKRVERWQKSGGWFGSYQWEVLETQADQVLVIAKNIVDYREFHADAAKVVTWDSSTIRAHLNGSFYNSFSEQERSHIIRTNTDNSGSEGCKNTDDYVFLLGSYFYSGQGHLHGDPTKVKDTWWLRTHHKEWATNDFATANKYNVVIAKHCSKKEGVRPALWLKIENESDVQWLLNNSTTWSSAGKRALHSANSQYRNRRLAKALKRAMRWAIFLTILTFTVIKPSVENLSAGLSITGKFGGIKWDVLEIQGGKALLLARDVLEGRDFYGAEKDVNWEDSGIRNYLNDRLATGFLYRFTEETKARILVTSVHNEVGNDTLDKVFLLSVEEVERYLPSQKSRVAKIEKTKQPWWLRSSGSNNTKAAIITKDGEIRTDGKTVSEKAGVRPAMWISIDKSLPSIDMLQGVYIGSYTSSFAENNEEIGLTLTIYQEGAQCKASFEFYNLPGKANFESGKLLMKVSVNQKGYAFAFEEEDLDDKPWNYSKTDLEGLLTDDVLSGTLGWWGGWFRVKRQTA